MMMRRISVTPVNSQGFGPSFIWMASQDREAGGRPGLAMYLTIRSSCLLEIVSQGDCWMQPDGTHRIDGRSASFYSASTQRSSHWQ